MATVGDQLTAPEYGWKRYDDIHPAFKYEGDWLKHSSSSHYNGTLMYTGTSAGQKFKFKFTGTKFRFMVNKATDRSTDIEVKVDGAIVGNYSEFSSVSTSEYQILAFEHLGLMDGEHIVEVTSIASGRMSLDSIDIDDTSSLLHPDEVADPSELEVGKRIRCHYTATSNAVGTFSNLGQETYVDGINDFIPPTSSAAPNGSFYYIMTDRDRKGRPILVADRNIQHSISWDTLNTAKIASGSGVSVDLNLQPFKFMTRLLTGGITSTDTSSEWDQWIVNSDLGGLIMPGDNSVWNWSGLYSHSSTTTSGVASDNRVFRGNAALSTHTSGISGKVFTTGGFRPVLTVENLSTTKFLIKDGTEIKRYYQYQAPNIQDITPVMTGESNPSPYVVTANDYNATNYPWKAFNSTGYWYVASIRPSDGHWLKIDLGSAKRIEKIEIASSIITGSQTGLKDWKLYGSNDDVSYAFVTEGSQVDENLKVHEFLNQTSYRYYRVNCLSNLSTSYPDHNIISVWNLYESIGGQEEGWQTVGTAPATKAMFEIDGVDNLNSLTSEAFKQLSPTFSFLAYTDYMNATSASHTLDYIDLSSVSRSAETVAIPHNKLLLPIGDIEVGDIEVGDIEVGDIEVGDIESVELNAINQGEVNNITPVMTSNSSPSPFVASASSAYNTTSAAAWNAFNRSDLNGWTASTYNTGWLQIKLDFKKHIFEYELMGHWSNNNYHPKSWELQGSNDGVNFEILSSENNITDWQFKVSKKFKVNNAGSYQYYRLNILETTSTNGRPTISQFNLFEVLPGNTDIKVIVSGDSGVTWSGKTLVDPTDLVAVKANGYTPAELNALTKEELASLFPNGKGRFAFYLEQEKFTDIVEIQDLTINEMQYTMTPSIEKIDVLFDLLKSDHPTYFVSRDDGVTWKAVEPDTLVSLADQPEGKNIRVKAVLQNGQELHGLSYSWI